MIEEVAKIIRVQNGMVVVETQLKTACGSCQANKNCGTSTIAKAFANKTHELCIETDEHFVIGQYVKIGVPEESILRASLYLYLYPILALIFSAVCLQFALPDIQELFVIIFSIFSASLSYIYISKKLKLITKESNFSPVILGLSDTIAVLPSSEIPSKTIE
ncbi:SoxR reducing system RseC family protein [Agaribacter flavus]|uniref:SoxR reducing system RseC family protein n=1 Tax=Agaribacter flavus TaxID=1902781 RepID=A0ABV7FP72_9ALTE